MPNRASDTLCLLQHYYASLLTIAFGRAHQFARINTAYEVLGDEIRRKRYEYALLHEKRDDTDQSALFAYDEHRDWAVVDYKVRTGGLLTLTATRIFSLSLSFFSPQMNV